ncbi:hypothetical protein GCM10022285_26580 [Streptomyces tunisiensis]|uniref:Uncharacterized protein n=1 Tax=Streptomyces tunisiensis TaxID=948699 RepID=A0ABP7YD53_9ACTN
MSRQPDEPPVAARADSASEAHSSGPPTLPEDLLLLLPWNSSVIDRARRLEQGNWGAGATGEAATRSMTAAIVSNVISATASVSARQ